MSICVNSIKLEIRNEKEWVDERRAATKKKKKEQTKKQ